MEEFQRPPTVGLVGCLALLASIVAPYLLLPASATSGLGVYYASGVAGPTLVALFALIATVAFAAGRQDRTDPGIAAGATLVLGVGMALVGLQWALAVDATVVAGIGTADWLAYHRWIVVAVGLVPALAAGWYARTLGLV